MPLSSLSLSVRRVPDRCPVRIEVAVVRV